MACTYKEEMSWVRNAIRKLYSAVSAQVAATRNALTDNLQNVRDTVVLYYNRVQRSGTTLHDEIQAETKENYYDAKDIHD